MTLLSRDQIRAKEDREAVEVRVPEWGGSVLVRGMTGKQRDEFQAAMMEQRGKDRVTNTANVTAKLVQACCVRPEDHDKRLFTPNDLEWLGGKSAAALERIGNKAAELCGMKPEDIEELTEGFDGPSGDDSSSASAPDSE